MTEPRSRNVREAPPDGGRRGQALLEFVAALTLVLVLTAALLQIGRLARARTRAMADARAAAGAAALSDVYRTEMPGPTYLADWHPGPDGRRYSHDDRGMPGTPELVVRHVIQPVRPAELAVRLPGNSFSAAGDPALLLPSFRLVRGAARSEPVELLPVVRRLLYDAPSITVEGEAWLVWTGGLQ